MGEEKKMKRISDKELLSRLQSFETAYLFKHWNTGGSFSGDDSINDISRNIIHVHKRIHGNCFLININYYDDERERMSIHYVPYYGQIVYNFEYSVLLPVYDPELIHLIKRWNDSLFSDKTMLLNQIFDRIKELKGYFLRWV